jgi:hypothetical protein
VKRFEGRENSTSRVSVLLNCTHDYSKQNNSRTMVYVRVCMDVRHCYLLLQITTASVKVIFVLRCQIKTHVTLLLYNSCFVYQFENRVNIKNFNWDVLVFQSKLQSC